MRKLSLIRLSIIGVIALAMSVAFVGCGEDEEDQSMKDTTAATTTATTVDDTDLEPASVEDPEFDILQILEDAGLYEALPSDIDYTVEATDHTNVTITLDAPKASGIEGMVARIGAFDQGDTSYEEHPSYVLSGVKYGIQFVTFYATDVQFDPSEPQQQSDYDRLVDAVKGFEVK